MTSPHSRAARADLYVVPSPDPDVADDSAPAQDAPDAPDASDWTALDKLLRDEPPLLKPRHVAALLGIAERTVLDHAKSGKLPSILIGEAVRFRQDDVRGVMAARRYPSKTGA